MEITRVTQLYEIFGLEIKGKSPYSAILELVKWGLIPAEGVLKCCNGHDLRLVKCDTSIDGWVWRCTERFVKNKRKPEKCNFYLSLRKGTFFDKSHLSIYQILAFSFMWCQNAPIQYIMAETEIKGDQTGTDWNNFCREVVVYSSFQLGVQIGGPGIYVEIDESKVGKRKYHKGHYVEGQWVFGGVERGTNKCFIVPVEDRSRETLLPLIKKYIRPGSIIVSDCWKVYDTLSQEGYVHYKVNHSENFVDPESKQHTNTIEGLWRHLKNSLPAFSRRNLFFNGYLQKFIFIRWCKAEGKNIFLQFAKYAGLLYNAGDAQSDLRREEFRQAYTEQPVHIVFEDEDVMDENVEDDVGEDPLM